MIFLDTCYFENLMDKRQSNHDVSLKINDYLINSNEKTVINTTVLVETLNRSIKTNTFADEMFENLMSNHELVVLTSVDYLDSLVLNRWYGNSINYSDCTIIDTMIKQGISNIVSFDSDFEKVDGFNVISSI